MSGKSKEKEAKKAEKERNIISELLSQEGHPSFKDIEEAAISAYKLARTEAEKGEKRVGADDIGAKLEQVLFNLLVQNVNPLDESQLKQLCLALEEWEAPSPMDLDEASAGDPTVAARCGQIFQVYNFLKEIVILSHKKAILKMEIVSYQEYLGTEARKEEARIWPYEESGKIIKAKEDVLSELDKTLTAPESKNTPIAELKSQLQAFKSCFDEKRGILESRRDRYVTIFLKVVLTVFSLSIAYWCGLWTIKGEKVAEKLDSTLGSPANGEHKKSAGEKKKPAEHKKSGLSNESF